MTYNNIRAIVSQVAAKLNEKNVRLTYGGENNFSKLATTIGLNDEVVNTITEQFVNELSFYKNVINPIISRFKDDVKTEAILAKKSGTATLPYEFYKTSKAVQHIFDTKCKERVTNYQPVTNSESLSIKTPVENMTEEEIYGLFTNTDDSTLNTLVVEILSKFSTLELKSFLRTYCIFITSATSTLDTVSYHTLLNGDIANVEEMVLMYAFVNSISKNELITNMDTSLRNETIDVINKNLISMISVCKGLLEHYKEEKIVTVSIKADDIASNRHDDYLATTTRGLLTTRELNLLFEEPVKEITEKIQVDAIGAILGSTKTVKRAVGGVDGTLPTIDDILSKQTKYLEDFRTYINLINEALNLRTLNNIITITTNVSERTYDRYVDENAETTLRDISVMPKDKFMSEVKDYLNKVDSSELLDIESNATAFYIVGKLLFGNTNFYKFALLTNVKRYEGDDKITFADKLQRKDYVFVAAVELLTDVVLDGIVVV